MMKQHRILPKLLVILCVTVLLMLLLPSCASLGWNASGSQGDLQWRYERSSKTLTISGTGPMPNFADAEDVAWASVRKHVRSLEISEGVTTVGDYAFYGMSALQSTVLPNSLLSFGNSSFSWCSSLSAISVPEGLVSIGERAFEGCASLNSMYLPQSVTSIGAYAFSYCSALKDFVMTAPAVSVASKAFQNCLSLIKPIFRSTVTEDMISPEAFYGTPLTFADMELSDRIIGSSTIIIQYLLEGEVIRVHEETCGFGMEYAVQTPEQAGYVADIPVVRGVADGTDVKWVVSYHIPIQDDELNLSQVKLFPFSMLAAVLMIVSLIGIGVAVFFLIRTNKSKQKHI